MGLRVTSLGSRLAFLEIPPVQWKPHSIPEFFADMAAALDDEVKDLLDKIVINNLH